MNGEKETGQTFDLSLTQDLSPPEPTGPRLSRFSLLPGLADFPANQIAELTPSAWPARTY